MRESEVAQSCPTLRDPMDCSPPGSSIHGIFPARVQEWGAIAFSLEGIGISNFLEEISIFAILLFSSIFLHWSLRKDFSSLLAILWNSAFRWVYLSFSFSLSYFLSIFYNNPMEYTVHGFLQARKLECIIFPFSRGSFKPRDWTQVCHIADGFFTSWATGKPNNTGVGSLSLLQWIFPTQELNWGLLHCRWIIYQLSYQESPRTLWSYLIYTVPGTRHV